ncbi:hypothetical protein QFC21_003690 [Naganishia friedmannii]|uniref:Uncharacterized protein n=1 Tax=Naganishia friedmannii TaxID=89922 RepID=A0ACC2VPU1_9TREE|nr:hypothetical protein QFC21_003690 [Naganishia friedmannii]
MKRMLSGREVENLKGANAFKMLMSGDNKEEDEDWRVAESDLKGDGKGVVGRRNAPFDKVEPTANLIKLLLGVDKKWVHGLPWDTPYELPGTGRVLITVLKANHCPGSSLFLFEGKQTVNAGDSAIKRAYVVGKRTGGTCTAVISELSWAEMVLYPAMKDKKLNVVYLYTTYLNPQVSPQYDVLYQFRLLSSLLIVLLSLATAVITACASPAKRTVLGIGTEDAPEVKLEYSEEPGIEPNLEGQADAGMQEKGKRLMRDWLVKQEDNVKAETGGADGTESKKRGRTLVIMGTYSIGKERIVKELHAMLTTDPLEATIHLVPLQTIQVDRLQPYLHKLKDHFSRVLAFRPTGCTYSPPAGTNMLPDINMVIRLDQKRSFTDAYLVRCEGRHISSRFSVSLSENTRAPFELSCFASSCPGLDVKMIATVNVGNEKSEGKKKKWWEKWQAEKVKHNKPGCRRYSNIEMLPTGNVACIVKDKAVSSHCNVVSMAAAFNLIPYAELPQKDVKKPPSQAPDFYLFR